MKKTLIFIALLAVIASFPIFNETSKHATEIKFLKVRDANPALTVSQVETLLGQPAHIDSSETTGMTGEVYQYPIADGAMKIVFVNGIVFHAEFVPGGKA